jgi:hypothetical protein
MAGLIWAALPSQDSDARIKCCSPPEFPVIYRLTDEDKELREEGWNIVLKRVEKDVRVMKNGYGTGDWKTLEEAELEIFTNLDDRLYYEGGITLANNVEWMDVPGDVLRGYPGIHARNGPEWRTRRDVLVVARAGHIFPISCERPWGWQQHITCFTGRVSAAMDRGSSVLLHETQWNDRTICETICHTMRREIRRMQTDFECFPQITLYFLDVRGDDLPEDIPMYGYGSGYVPLEQESLDQWLDVLKVHSEEEVVPYLIVTPGETVVCQVLSPKFGFPCRVMQHGTQQTIRRSICREIRKRRSSLIMLWVSRGLL